MMGSGGVPQFSAPKPQAAGLRRLAKPMTREPIDDGQWECPPISPFTIGDAGAKSLTGGWGCPPTLHSSPSRGCRGEVPDGGLGVSPSSLPSHRVSLFTGEGVQRTGL